MMEQMNALIDNLKNLTESKEDQGKKEINVTNEPTSEDTKINPTALVPISKRFNKHQ